MYLTKCKVEKKKSLGCRIYISKRNGQLWVIQPLQKNDSNTSIGHPSISNDKKTLIFSSDMKGGYGGKDLWIVKKEKRNKWSKPVNLGPAVNTSTDEMFPFLHQTARFTLVQMVMAWVDMIFSKHLLTKMKHILQ